MTALSEQRKRIHEQRNNFDLVRLHGLRRWWRLLCRSCGRLWGILLRIRPGMVSHNAESCSLIDNLLTHGRCMRRGDAFLVSDPILGHTSLCLFSSVSPVCITPVLSHNY